MFSKRPDSERDFVKISRSSLPAAVPFKITSLELLSTENVVREIFFGTNLEIEIRLSDHGVNSFSMEFKVVNLRLVLLMIEFMPPYSLVTKVVCAIVSLKVLVKSTWAMSRIMPINEMSIKENAAKSWEATSKRYSRREAIFSFVKRLIEINLLFIPLEIGNG